MTRNKQSRAVMIPYRWMHELYLRHVPLLPRLIQLLWFRILLSCYIPCSCRIGPDTVFPHGALGVMLHEQCEIGARCKIQCHAVIGGRGGRAGAPKIGNDVLVGTHAVILGKICIGDHAVIGAGAVATEDVAPYAIVAGPKAGVIGVLQKDQCVF